MTAPAKLASPSAPSAPPAKAPDVRINPWLRRYHPAPSAAVRLLYFPHAGSSASACLRLSAALPPHGEVLGVQYPGRQDRFAEPPLPTVDALAAAVHHSLADLDDGRPLAFFGHSMGAIVAYEVARRMAAEGAAPTRLIVSGRRAPHVVRDDHVHKGGDAALIAQLRKLSGT
ncbi:MAG: thioesterase II family protein, partial [Actinocrinis sp.]